MKVAKARYTGPMRSHHRRAPSGRDYNFTRTPANGAKWQEIEDPDDARWLEDQSAIEVEWHPLGRVKAAGDDAMEAIEEMGYQAKRKLASELDLGLSGNPDGDTLDEELQEYVREMTED